MVDEPAVAAVAAADCFVSVVASDSLETASSVLAVVAAGVVEEVDASCAISVTAAVLAWVCCAVLLAVCVSAAKAGVAQTSVADKVTAMPRRKANSFLGEYAICFGL